MKSISNYLASNKTRYQRITLIFMVLCPILMFFAAQAEQTTWIIIGLILIVVANIIAVFSK